MRLQAFLVISALLGLFLVSSPVAAQCAGPQRSGSTLGLYEADAQGEGVRTSPFSGRVPVKISPTTDLDDGVPAKFDVLVDCDRSEFVVYQRPLDSKGRVLLWFSLAWLPLLLGGIAGGIAGRVVSMRRATRRDDEDPTMWILGGAFVGAVMLAVAWQPPVFVFAPGNVEEKALAPRPIEAPPTEEAYDLEPGENPCEDTAMCRKRGECAFEDGECVVPDSDACRDSEGCEEEAKCSLVEGRCRATNSDCKRWSRCAESAVCTEVDGSCTRTDADCRASTKCAEVGACSAGDESCVPKTEEDCQASELCQEMEARLKVEKGTAGKEERCGLVQDIGVPPRCGKLSGAKASGSRNPADMMKGMGEGMGSMKEVMPGLLQGIQGQQ